MLIIDFIDRADVGMIQRGCGFGFALKAAEGLGIFRYLLGQEFEGHKSPELNILGPVNHTHPPAAELLNDAVMRDGLADHCLETALAEAC